jgi:hypothetical protein
MNDEAFGNGPRLAERMRTLAAAADRESILQRIASLTQSDARLWGKMSAPQMVCHLCDAYRLPLGEKTASPATGFLPPTIMKWIALRLPLKWPHGVATRPEMEQGVGGTPPAEFERDRANLLSIVRRFCDTAAPATPHPFFGPMSRQDWLRWGYLHADHHLRQFGR